MKHLQRILAKFGTVALVVALALCGLPAAFAATPASGSEGAIPGVAYANSAPGVANANSLSGEKNASDGSGSANAHGLSGEKNASDGSGSANAHSAQKFSGSYADDQIIVVYNSDQAADQGLSTLAATLPAGEELNQEIVADQIQDTAIAVVDIPDGLSVQDAVALAESDPAVAYAQPNYIYHLLDDATPKQLVQIPNTIQGEPAQSEPSQSEPGHLAPLALKPNDPMALVSQNIANTPNQWNLYDVNALDALQTVNTTHSVTVAILDTGCRLTHDDLRANLNTTDAWDAVDNIPLTTAVGYGLVGNNGDVSGHGTHVAGIIGGVLNNGYGIAGIAGNNASLLPIMVFNPPATAGGEPAAATSTIVAGYNYLMTKAAALNIRVVNMSLGEYGDADKAFETAIKTAQNTYGIVTVAAAGNGDTSDSSYPSDFAETVSVEAIGSSDVREIYSDFNASKDISAPGGEVWSSYYDSDDSFAMLSGTSMAAPVVSAAAAVLFAEDPTISVAAVKGALYDTAYDLGASGWDEYYGWGKVNMALAVSSVDWNKHPSKLSIEGPTRYGTMAAAAEMYRSAARAKGLGTPSTAIISSGQNFPDALAASGLSGVLNSPVLTTTNSTLSTETLNKLTGMRPSTVILTGDSNSVSNNVATQVKAALGNSVHIARLAGDTRIQTAEAIYDYGKRAGTWGKTAILAYAFNYPDALSIAPYAYAKKAPIFLTDTNQITAATEAALLNGGFTDIVIVGDSKSIATKIQTSLQSKGSGKGITVKRWAGADRYQTSVDIAKNVLAERSIGTPLKIGFTTGQNFPDGLASSPLLGLNSDILILVADSPTGKYAVNAFLKPNASQISDILYFGSTASVSASLRATLATAAGVN